MRGLAQKIQELHEAYWTQEKEASRRHHVVLVEGDDDREILGEIFRQRSRTWETRVRIVAAGGRTRVLERMQTTFPQALGLVDRDTWTDEEVASQREEEPRLYVTEGWCLENIFLNPKFIQRYDESLATQLSAQRERWVRAGALWWVLQRTREAQQDWQKALDWSKSYGSLREDLDSASAPELVKILSQRIPDTVRRAANLDIEAVAAAFEHRLEEVQAHPEDKQWMLSVHGKSAFKRLLVPALHASHGQKNWRRALAAEVGRPAPLDDMIAMLLPGG